MKKFLNSITNNSIGILRKPVIFEIIQSVFQGQPFFVILLAVQELIKPLDGQGIDANRLYMLLAWLAASIVLLFFFGKAVYNMEHSAAYTIGSEGRLALGEYLRKLSMGFYKGRDPGDITALLLQDYSNIETMISNLLMAAIGAVVLPVVFFFFLLPFDWRLTLLTVAPIPLAGLGAFISQKIVMYTGTRHIKAKNEASSRMLEYLDGMKNIKAFNLQGEKFQRLHKAFDLLKRKSIQQEAVTGPSVILAVWILNAGIALVMLMGIKFLLVGTLSLGNFLIFLIVGTRMYDPLSKVMINFVELTYYSISGKRIRELYSVKPLPEPEKSNIPDKHNVEFEHVWFHYHDTDVLRDVSFRLEENTMTALVGPSGAGKSTITRLIARFWDVNKGVIKVGGIPLSNIKNEDLISRISMVFQDVYLFNDTILENIKIGNAEASPEEVRAAAVKARCHEFIEKLPKGYDTVVGEGGSTLSGGEKQRISIARAILKDSPIVLLDEATASLDPENELHIQDAIGELVKGRTLIVIAHRLSTITHANQILVLKDGEIAERGTHDELLQDSDGVYAGMWNEQRKAHNWKVGSKSYSGIIGK